MNFKNKIISVFIGFSIVVGSAYGIANSVQRVEYSEFNEIQSPQKETIPTKKDTTLHFPVSNQTQNTYDDLNIQYPMDLKDPDNVKSVVEYDVKTGNYILRTKVGDNEVGTPYTLTPEEYKKYSEQQEINRYWRSLNSDSKKNNEDKFSVTDMKFSLGPADKLFGPGGVQLKTSGQAELIFGFKSNFINNPALTERTRRTNIPNFDQKIQLNVTGKVGDKVNFGMNYNTEASFDFDQKMIKLNYKGKEDDIIQSLEAGNVSMQLNSSLITGSTALFGLKSDLQFGKLKVSALASQQESQAQTVSSRGGAQTTNFEVNCDQYDANRHFFLGHYFRNRFEKAMSSLPQITSGIKINRVELWVTNKRGNYDQSRNIVAFMDLAEATAIDKPLDWQQKTSDTIPQNNANNLYEKLKTESEVRNIQQTNAYLSGNYPRLFGGEDYEKIESARRLDNAEYSVNYELGYISLRSTLNPDEVLAVAYDYTYGGKTYQVGEFSTEKGDSIQPPKALILKLLKSTSQSPKAKSWDLMMKNVYSIGAMQMQQEAFEMNVMYQNDSIGTELRYLQEGDIANKLLLRVMNLDNLNTKQHPTADGKFDYVEGYTAQSSSGRVIFPVLEPFGSHLKRVLGTDASIAKKYVFQELYDSTLVVAQEFSEKNKFRLVGKYKGTAGRSEISLNAMNVPRGSVTVTAGGMKLTENVDYTVDYTMGTVTILNQSILDANTNIDVKLENQSLFSMQRKSLLGTHLEYEFSKNFTVGGTLMHLSEMPLTKKVNTGSEPLKNTIWGLNLAWRKESQWLTNALDKIPFVEATQPSSIALNAEFAQLIPGHSKVIGSQGLAYLDDFESTKTTIDIHYPYGWYLASTPAKFEEAKKSNDIEYGKNRALISWFTVDPILNGDRRDTPSNLRGNLESQSNHLTRAVRETELFPYKDLDPTRSSLLPILNLSYYPTQRGPYNLDVDGVNTDGTLQNPDKRWGGIMRKLDNTDFETANIEYIEFWMMDPFNSDNPDKIGGNLYFNLGDISEDILKDGKKFFENGMSVNGDTTQLEKTVWGKIPKTQSTVTAFDNTPAKRKLQDIGIDGLTNDEEHTYPTYKNYIDKLKLKLNSNPGTLTEMQNDPFSPLNDPAGDKYHFYRGSDYDDQSASIITRYKHYNGTEGNSPASEDTNESYTTTATLLPDVEDINSDNTLNEYEKYFQYKVSIRPDSMKLGTNFITDVVTSNVTLKNGKKEEIKWYQFKIPIREYEKDPVGNIRNFKSIRFIRMFLTDFQNETHLRFGTLDLVRGEWKSYTKPLYSTTTPPSSTGKLDVLAVNIEENGRKTPVNYILPPGVTRETDPSQPQLLQQNEQSMVLKVTDLAPKDARGVYKTTYFDMRKYKRMQMFVHAEAFQSNVSGLKDNELTCYVRMGSDMKNNYYEYEVPLRLTPERSYSGEKLADRDTVWNPQNMFDFPFKVLTDAKLKRNKERNNGVAGVEFTKAFDTYDPEKPANKITVVGNPTISEIENIMIGVRNVSSNVKSGEIWVNELRMSEFDESSGWAGIASLNMNLSDLGYVNVSGTVETSGFGGIESNITTRRMDDLYQMNLAASLDLGRFLPEQAKLQIPAYYGYTTETNAPKYNPLDEDIVLKEALDNLDSKNAEDSLKSLTQTVRTVESFNINNAKVNIKSKKSMFYDPANLSISYSSNVTKEHSPEIEQDLVKVQRAGLNYSYSFNSQPWEPFKNAKALKSSAFKLIKDFNVYLLPTSLNYSTNLNREFSKTKLRSFELEGNSSSLPDGVLDTTGLSFSKDFMWNRQFDIQWSLTRELKFSLQTAMNSNIAESPYTPEIGKEYYEEWRDTVWNSIRKMGTPYTYQQVFNASYEIPINKLPLLDWISSNATYNSTYSWNKNAILSNMPDLGNNTSSVGNWSLSGNMNFENLYNKIKYLKGVNTRAQQTTKKRFEPKKYSQTYKFESKTPIVINHQLGSKKFTITAKDKDGKVISVPYKVKDEKSIEITPTVNADDVTINMVSKDPNERNAAQLVGDFTSRFLMGIRRVNFSYRGSSSLVIPGFMNQPGFLGQQKVDGVYSPGLAFVFGIHDDNTLQDFYDKGWLYTGKDVVNPANEAFTSDLNINATIEPIPGLKIDLTMQRQTATNSTIQYMHEGMPSTFNGNFNTTQVAIRTAFDRIGSAEENYYSPTFNQFMENRKIILGRLANNMNGRAYPNSGFFTEADVAARYSGKTFNSEAGLGNYDINSPEVLIPAFLSAYTGQDPLKVNTNPFLSLLQILPNWNLNYNGLSNLEFFREKFRSVSITHAYTNRYTIGNYTSFANWVPVDGSSDNMMGFVFDGQNEQAIPAMAYDVSSVSMNESFSPLIGVNIAMKNNITAKTEIRKQRNLSLNLTSTQLIEADADEFLIGIGYVVNDFKLFKNSSKKSNVKNDLKLNADVSYKDVKTLLRKVNEEITQASSGNKLIAIKVMADYVFSSKVNLQLFFDRQSTVPLISSTFPVSSTNFGISFKFMLTR